MDDIEFGFRYVILPVEVFFGIVTNLIVIGIWMFGAKSKLLCCANYFSANAALDLLNLAFPGLVYVIMNFNIYMLPNTVTFCKVYMFTVYAFQECSNWISAAVTVERSLTILLPFMFNPRQMRKRSVYVIIALVLIIMLANIHFFFRQFYIEADFANYCATKEENEIEKHVSLFREIFDQIICTIIPVCIIVVLNCGSLITLCRNKYKRRALSSNQQNNLTGFTRLVLFTGLSYVSSNLLWVLFILHVYGVLKVGFNSSIEEIANVMLYFNSFANPVLCLIVCKSVREDFKDIIRFLANLVGCGQREDMTLDNIPGGNSFENTSVQINHTETL